MKTAVYILTILFTTHLISQDSVVLNKNIQKTTHVYKQVQNLKIHADLYKHKNDNILKPVIVWIHGGALIFGGRDDIPKEQINFYLEAGYSLFSIDYRLAPETKLPEIVTDVKDAINWVRVNGEKVLGVNSKKVIVVGHSAGAYLALMSGYILENPPEAIVSFYGYGDILGDWYNKPDPFYSKWDPRKKEHVYKTIGQSTPTNGSFDDRFDLYVYYRQHGLWTQEVANFSSSLSNKERSKYCPNKNITRDYPPTLLIHGDKDTDVPFSQSEMLDQELERNDVKHQFILLPESDHLFDIMEGGLESSHVKKVFDEVVKFLNKIQPTQKRVDRKDS